MIYPIEKLTEQWKITFFSPKSARPAILLKHRHDVSHPNTNWVRDHSIFFLNKFHIFSAIHRPVGVFCLVCLRARFSSYYYLHCYLLHRHHSRCWTTLQPSSVTQHENTTGTSSTDWFVHQFTTDPSPLSTAAFVMGIVNARYELTWLVQNC